MRYDKVWRKDGDVRSAIHTVFICRLFSFQKPQQIAQSSSTDIKLDSSLEERGSTPSWKRLDRIYLIEVDNGSSGDPVEVLLIEACLKLIQRRVQPVLLVVACDQADTPSTASMYETSATGMTR